jgi:hypothetical protein
VTRHRGELKLGGSSFSPFPSSSPSSNSTSSSVSLRSMRSSFCPHHSSRNGATPHLRSSRFLRNRRLNKSSLLERYIVRFGIEIRVAWFRTWGRSGGARATSWGT